MFYTDRVLKASMQVWKAVSTGSSRSTAANLTSEHTVRHIHLSSRLLAPDFCWDDPGTRDSFGARLLCLLARSYVNHSNLRHELSRRTSQSSGNRKDSLQTHRLCLEKHPFKKGQGRSCIINSIVSVTRGALIKCFLDDTPDYWTDCSELGEV